jgi:Holliday junction resolvasome RuvABC DNA-binding subunit
VGRKIAERLAVELRDKIAALGVGAGREAEATPAAAARGVPSGRLGEVYGALVSLGYRPPEFEALLGGLDREQPTADLIKQALAALRRK